MAQIDVHRNKGRHQATVPYLVIVQSSQFDSYRRRVVVPMVRASAVGRVGFDALNRNLRSAARPWYCTRSISFPFPATNSACEWLPCVMKAPASWARWTNS